MKKIILYILLTVLVFGSNTSFAQEALTNLQVNPKIKDIYLNQKKTKSTQVKSSLELPFIDDFAKAVGYPDSSLWMDKYAFSNFTYAYEPYSIGVVTLDAINSNGSIYSNANSTTFGADTLTSKPINLLYPGDKTIFLSFLYQPGGLGDTPDIKDSLILEYYSLDSLRWDKIWYVIFDEKDSLLKEYFSYNESPKLTKANNLSKTFHNVIVPVSENQYLKDDFQFRFRNRASLSTTEDSESKASNCDHWNIDYVVLNKDRNINDTIIDDAAIKYPNGSMLKYYESIPWKHYRYIYESIKIDTFSITYINNSNHEWNFGKEFKVKDLMGKLGTEIPFIEGSNDPILPMSIQRYKRFNDFKYLYNTDNDSALFEFSCYMTSTSGPERKPYRWNDTTRFYQKFYNYYAFDDGSAENGYGIIGEGTENAMVAMRFQTFVKDTLRGIQMYFNQTLDNASQYNTFKIHVWNEIDGKPGSIIYTLEGAKPQSEDELNKFTLFTFDDPIILNNGNFFIGWQKNSSSEMLNVGFDVNRINNNNLYYNFAGEWVNSQLEGTVMIRPMFGHDVVTAIADEPKTNTIDYVIYPNPARDQLNINIQDDQQTDFRYTIFDTYGRVFIDEINIQSSINISNLNSGIYFIRISSTFGKSTTKKFIIIH